VLEIFVVFAPRGALSATNIQLAVRPRYVTDLAFLEAMRMIGTKLQE